LPKAPLVEMVEPKINEQWYPRIIYYIGTLFVRGPL